MASYSTHHTSALSGVSALAQITDATSASDPAGTNCNKAYWEAHAYDQIRAIYVELGSAPGSGVTGNFTINNDNASADTEDSFLYFHRGNVPGGNAALQWDASETAFRFNYDVLIAGANLGKSGTRVTKIWTVDLDVSGTLTATVNTTGTTSDSFTADSDDTNHTGGSGTTKFNVSRGASTDAYVGFDEADDTWKAHNGTNLKQIVRVDDSGTLKVGMLNSDIYAGSGGNFGAASTLARSDHNHSGGSLAATGTSETTFTLDDDYSSGSVNIELRFASSANYIRFDPSTSGPFLFSHGLRANTHNALDLGTTDTRWRHGYLEGNLDVDGTLDIEGATTLQGAATLQSTVSLNDATVTLDADDTNHTGGSGTAKFNVSRGASTDAYVGFDEAGDTWKAHDGTTEFALVLDTKAQTLTNKTLSSPTLSSPIINTGGSWSGNPTFSGSPVFSSTPSFTNNPAFSGTPSFTGTPSFGVAGPAQPFTVTSTATVTNLSADTVDGIHGTAFLQKSGGTMTGDLDMGGNDITNIGSLGAHQSSHLSGGSDPLAGVLGAVSGATNDTWRVNSNSDPLSDAEQEASILYLGSTNTFYLSLADLSDKWLGAGGADVDLVPGSASDNQDIGHTSRRWRRGNFKEWVNFNQSSTPSGVGDGSLWSESGSPQAFRVRLGSANYTFADGNGKTGLSGTTTSWSMPSGGSMAGTFSGTPIFSGNLTFSGIPSFTVAGPSVPFAVTSTATVTNLSADMVDGTHVSSLLLKSGGTMTGGIDMGSNSLVGITFLDLVQSTTPGGISDGSVWSESGTPSTLRARLASTNRTILDSNNKTAISGSTTNFSVPEGNAFYMNGTTETWYIYKPVGDFGYWVANNINAFAARNDGAVFFYQDVFVQEGKKLYLDWDSNTYFTYSAVSTPTVSLFVNGGLAASWT